MKNIVFYVQYYVYIFILKIIKRRYEYTLVLSNTFPTDLKKPLKQVINNDGPFKYILQPNSVLLFFQSSLKIKEIHKIFSKYLGPTGDNLGFYFLFKVNNRNNQLLISKDLYDRLLANDGKDVDLSIDEIQSFFNLLKQMKDNFEMALVNNDAQIGDIFSDSPLEAKSDVDEITIDDVNIVLEKINLSGYNSLTSEEKLILKKYQSK